MLEAMIDSLDYFDNQGNNKLEQQLRIALKELDKDLQLAQYAPPKSVSESITNLNDALEDVVDFAEENDLSDSEIVDAEFEEEDENEDDNEPIDESDDDDDSEDPD